MSVQGHQRQGNGMGEQWQAAASGHDWAFTLECRVYVQFKFPRLKYLQALVNMMRFVYISGLFRVQRRACMVSLARYVCR